MAPAPTPRAARQATASPSASPSVLSPSSVPPLPSTRPSATSSTRLWSGPPPESAFRILIATDNHLGYLEKDPIRGEDSFRAFEEVLQIAAARDVDFVLLGGDLFHENKPSRRCLVTTLRLLRHYCLGDRPVPFTILSDQAAHFGPATPRANYQDPHLNVGLPVFSIHGNHDDPAGDGNLCSLDLLAAAGLVNYFGKQTAVDHVRLDPILLRKGDCRVALYGLGNIRDERLHKTMLAQHTGASTEAGAGDDDNDNDNNDDAYFNLMVIHQNRVPHGATSYIPEEFLDDRFDLVLWGHEHECCIDPVRNTAKGFHITQPGSSVATSLSPGEAVPKHVGILTIRPGHQFHIEPVPLTTTRPFVIDDIALAQLGLQPHDHEAIQLALSDKVEQMIATAHAEWRDAHPDRRGQPPPKPLIRLRVEYSGGYTTLHPQRFGQAFAETTANPKDVLHFYRRRVYANPYAPHPTAGGGRSGTTAPRAPLAVPDPFLPDRPEDVDVQEIVATFLAAQSLQFFAEAELSEAVRLFVDKDDRSAIADFVGSTLETAQTALQQ
ncbi:hypothetical protein CXG81DRAFT_14986, partial [Caulochytrium protostelioides]